MAAVRRVSYRDDVASVGLHERSSELPDGRRSANGRRDALGRRFAWASSSGSSGTSGTANGSRSLR